MKVYLDHNATTSMHPDVLAAMRPYLTEQFGNPSSMHAWGREARQALEGARRTVAQSLGAADKDCVVFTGGGTEADNLALRGVLDAQGEGGGHLIVPAGTFLTRSFSLTSHMDLHLERGATIKAPST